MRKSDNNKKLRRLYQHYDIFEASHRALRWIAPKVSTEEQALEQLLCALNQYGRRPRLLAMQQVGFELMARPDRLACLVYAQAVKRWYSQDDKLCLLIGAFVTREFASAGHDSSDTQPVRRLLYEVAMPLLRGSSLEPVRFMLMEMIATEYSSDPDLGRQQAGLTMLEDVVQHWRKATTEGGDEDQANAKSALAKSLYNLATSLKTFARTPLCSDPRTVLKRSLDAHNEAMAIPERMDPALSGVSSPLDPIYLSYRERASCLRELASEEEDVRAVLQLLDEALSDLAEAERLALQLEPIKGSRVASVLMNRSNVMAMRCRALFEIGDVRPEEILVELTNQESNLAQPWLMQTQARRLVPQARNVLTATRHSISSGGAITEEMVLAIVKSAIQFAHDPVAVGIPDARLRVVSNNLGLLFKHRWQPDATDADASEGYPEFALPPQTFWEWVHQVTDRVVPAAVTAEGLGEYLDALELWFSIYATVDSSSRSHDVDLDDWRARVLLLAKEGLIPPTLSTHERRVLARAVRLWGPWPVRHDDASPEARLIAADAIGSVAWRSDLAFFGSGPQCERGPAVPDEAIWRCNVFRARWEMDNAAAYLRLAERAEANEELRDGIQPFLDAGYSHYRLFDSKTPPASILEETGVDPSEWFETPDGIAVGVHSKDLAEVRSRLDKTRLELSQELTLGEKAGFQLGRAGVLWPEEDDLVDWLRGHLDTVILVADPSFEIATYRMDVGELIRRDVPDLEALHETLGEFLEARDEHSFGVTDQEALERRAADVGREAAYLEMVASPEAAAELERKLDRLLDSWGAALSPVLQEAAQAGGKRLLILARGRGRDVPWPALTLGGEPTQASWEVVFIETLAEVSTAARRRGAAVTYVGGTGTGRSPMALGRAVFQAVSDEVVGPTGRNAFEAAAGRAVVLRIWAHGETIAAMAETSGLVLNEDDRRPINRYSVSELCQLDLRGARRVELWACESARQDLWGAFDKVDEPVSLDASLHLAGAEIVVGSSWIQFALPTAMIAEAFSLRLLTSPLTSEAEALGWAIGTYREDVAVGGVFAEALREASKTSPNHAIEQWLDSAWTQWRLVLWHREARDAPAAVKNAAGTGCSALGAVRPPSADRTLEKELRWMRSPLTWAGWRISARSKEVAFQRHPLGHGEQFEA